MVERILTKMDQFLPFIRSKVWKIILNSGFLAINTLTGSLFGYIFWILVSRLYTKSELGISAALISAVAILANLGDLGLGISYIRFGPSMQENQSKFLNTTMLALLSATLLFTILFLVLIPVLMPEIKTGNMLIFIALFIGVSLSFSTAQLLDKFFIAFESTFYSSIRILIANLIRLGIIFALSPSNGAINLVIAVGLGALLTSMATIKIYVPRFIKNYRFRISFEYSLIKDKVRFSLSNYLSQILWTAPPLVFPIIILVILGREANAHFYITWMIVNVLFIIPQAISTSVFASASSPGKLSTGLFRRILLFTMAGLIPLVVLFGIFSNQLLGIFGNDYANRNQLFQLLLISIFPYTFNTFVIVKLRINKNNLGVVVLSFVITMLSLTLTSIFAIRLGLDGAGYGWLISQSIGVIASILVLNGFGHMNRKLDTTKIVISQ